MPDHRNAHEPGQSQPLRLLILGGTGIIGPHHVRCAVDRGHRVSVFNRGQRPSDLPKAVEHLRGDRDGDLSALLGRDWDAVIDLPAILPRWVRGAGEALAARTRHYTFISSLAVYQSGGDGDLGEGSPLREYQGQADPFSLNTFDLDLYGPLKVIAEREAERLFPGRSLIVRPGLIVGPGDETDRFTYWPMRLRAGGDVLAPGNPLDPVQVIDVRDLAEWVIRMVEARETGAYNANGPATPLSFCEMLGGIRSLYAAPTTLTWVPSDWLAEHGATMADLPAWYPSQPALANRASVRAAVAKGLTFRPLATTVLDTMAWRLAGQTDLPTDFKGGWTREREREMLAAWRGR